MDMGMTRENVYQLRAERPLPLAEARALTGDVTGLRYVQRDGGLAIPAAQVRVYLAAQGMGQAEIDAALAPYVLWEERFANLVVNAGLNDALDKHLKGSSYTAAWYVGLADGTPTPAAADTMASHAGWSEVTAYDELVRQTLTLGSVSSQSVSNSASPAAFTIDTNSTTIGGAFIVSDDTKGGTDGVLYGVGAFTAGDKTLDDGDTLSVTVTCTAAAS